MSGVSVRVVDIFSVKPVDAKTLKKCSEETKGNILVIEDHYPEGGIRGELPIAEFITCNFIRCCLFSFR